MKTRGLIHSENLQGAALATLTLISRILTLEMIETGGDAVWKWYAMRKLLHGLGYSLDHHTMRMGIQTPLFIIQAFFGDHPLLYYAAPLAFSALTAFLIFKTGALLRSRTTGVIAVLFYISFFHMIRANSQILPSGFSGVYVLASVYFFIRYLDGGERGRPFLILSSIFMFLAYETKIPNLFFLPGFLPAFVAGKRRFKDMMLFAGMFAALLAIEHVAYLVLEGEALGRIGVISRTYVNGTLYDFRVDSIWGLFARYKMLPAYWEVHLYSLILFLVTAFFIKIPTRERIPGYILAAFFILTLITVKSFNPVRPLQVFHVRYLLVSVPLSLIVTSLLITKYAPELLRRSGWFHAGDRKLKPAKYILMGFFSIYAILQTAGHLVPGNRHPLRLLPRYYEDINRAIPGGVPIVLNGYEQRKHDVIGFVFYNDFSGGSGPASKITMGEYSLDGRIFFVTMKKDLGGENDLAGLVTRAGEVKLFEDSHMFYYSTVSAAGFLRGMSGKSFSIVTE